jgi:hypothetical protein
VPDIRRIRSGRPAPRGVRGVCRRRYRVAPADQVAARTADQVFSTLGELKGGAAKLGRGGRRGSDHEGLGNPGLAGQLSVPGHEQQLARRLAQPDLHRSAWLDVRALRAGHTHASVRLCLNRMRRGGGSDERRLAVARQAGRPGHEHRAQRAPYICIHVTLAARRLHRGQTRTNVACTTSSSSAVCASPVSRKAARTSTSRHAATYFSREPGSITNRSAVVSHCSHALSDHPGCPPDVPFAQAFSKPVQRARRATAVAESHRTVVGRAWVTAR